MFRNTSISLVKRSYNTLFKTQSRTIASFRPHYGLWIHGEEVEADCGEKFIIEDPATLEPLCTVAEGRGWFNFDNFITCM